MSTVLIIVLLILLLGGGGYYGHRSYGAAGLGGVLGRDVRVKFERADAGAQAQTPAQQRARADSARQSAAEDAVHGDPIVRSLIETFDARVIPDSVRPVGG